VKLMGMPHKGDLASAFGIRHATLGLGGCAERNLERLSCPVDLLLFFIEKDCPSVRGLSALYCIELVPCVCAVTFLGCKLHGRKQIPKFRVSAARLITLIHGITQPPVSHSGHCRFPLSTPSASYHCHSSTTLQIRPEFDKG
jgi:hypothetical protein